MTTTKLTDVIIVKDRNVLLRIIFYLELVIKKDIQLSDNELNVLSLFVDLDNKEEVIKLGIDKGFIKSKQSGENIVSRLVKLKVLDKMATNKRKIAKEHLPLKLEQYIYSTFVIHNLDDSKN